MPYMYPDLNTARDLRDAGAASIMPLGAPIGSNKGLATRDFIKIIIDEIALPVISTPGLAAPPRPVKPWKWVPLPSWPIPPSLQPAISL